MRQGTEQDSQAHPTRQNLPPKNLELTLPAGRSDPWVSLVAFYVSYAISPQ